MARLRGTTEAEEQKNIYENAAGAQNKRERHQKLQAALARKRAEFPMLSGRKIRILSVDSLREVFEPMMEAITKKLQHVQLLQKDQETYDRLTQELGAADSEDSRQGIMSRLDDLSEPEAWLAYASKGGEQFRYIRAASYADERCATRCSQTGRLLSYFRVFWLCRGHNPACNGITVSRQWATKFVDPLASGQKWYCFCGTKYAPRFGVFLELATPQGVYHCKATIPHDLLWDIQALHCESQISAASASELYSKVPSVPPSTGEVVVPVDPSKGQFRLASEAVYQQLPTFEWEDIFTFVGHKMPEKPPKRR